MRIGILLCGHAPDEVQQHFGDFDQMFKTLLGGHGFNFKAWPVVDNEFPQSIHNADGWLLTGSKHGAYEDHPFIKPLEQFIRDVAQTQIPMVGVCFGHQIIAQALGGRVEKFKEGWALGQQTYRHDQLGQIALNAWHQDQVVEKPASARVLARNDFCANAALMYAQSIYTIQPHPEFSNALLPHQIAARRDNPMYPKDLMDRAEAKTTLPIDDALMADDIAAFFLNAHKNMVAP